VVADRHRRGRQEILLREARRFLVPALPARPRIERDEVIVRRDEVQIVAPHRRAAVADVRAALRLPEVVPQLVTVVGVERPHVVGRGDVQHVVHHQHGALHHRAADRDVARAFAAHDRFRGGTRAGSAGDLRDPRERQIFHVRLIDLRERAVAAAGVVAGVRRPLIGERLEQRRRIETLRTHDSEREARKERQERKERNCFCALCGLCV